MAVLLALVGNVSVREISPAAWAWGVMVTFAWVVAIASIRWLAMAEWRRVALRRVTSVPRFLALAVKQKLFTPAEADRQMSQRASLEAGSAWPDESGVADEVLIARTAWHWALPLTGSGVLVAGVAYGGQRVLGGTASGSWGDIASLVGAAILAGFLAVSVPTAFKQRRQPVLVLNSNGFTQCIDTRFGYNQLTDGSIVRWSEVASVDFRWIVLPSNETPEDCMVVTTTSGQQIAISIEQLAIHRDELDYLIEVFRARAAKQSTVVT